jgi:hypothetical protein
MDRGRLLAAVVLVPVVDAFVAFVALPPPFTVIAGIMGLLVMLSGALPVFYWLRNRGPVTFLRILVAGVALGNLPFAIFAAAMIPFALGHWAMGTLSEHLVPVSALLAGSLFPIAIGSGMGLVSAVVFWFTAVHGTEVAG